MIHYEVERPGKRGTHWKVVKYSDNDHELGVKYFYRLDDAKEYVRKINKKN